MARRPAQAAWLQRCSSRDTRNRRPRVPCRASTSVVLLFGVSRYVAVPLAAVVVSWQVLAGSFHRVEHVLMVLAGVFVAYVGAGVLAHPDWSAAFTGLVTPRMSFSHGETLIVAATVGTTLAPWGLSFIQSYAVDKKPPRTTSATSGPTW